ncbi:hypothetical protein RvY_16929 [Ramazzottius varieornatus]|uniref:Uncharacterized protein n=1 Tax=Ramazzottius varieornatus TaxID=947166 RepID=A0A1D1W0V7_RAMVA|nr:hypothetical protein RvY_16929 [Ramazzottius varieornatus]
MEAAREARKRATTAISTAISLESVDRHSGFLPSNPQTGSLSGARFSSHVMFRPKLKDDVAELPE